MLDNLATDGKENGGDRNLVLQQVTENSLDEANKQRGSFKENGRKKQNILRNGKKQLVYIMLEEELETGYSESMRDMGR